MTRLSLKCSAWKGVTNFALRKFRSEKNFVSEIFFQKQFGSEKFWSEKKVLSEKILVRKNFG